MTKTVVNKYDLKFFNDDLPINKKLIVDYSNKEINKYEEDVNRLKELKENYYSADWDERAILIQEIRILEQTHRENPNLKKVNIEDLTSPYFFFCTDEEGGKKYTYISRDNYHIREGDKAILCYTDARAFHLRYKERSGDNKYYLSFKNGIINDFQAELGTKKKIIKLEKGVVEESTQDNTESDINNKKIKENKAVNVKEVKVKEEAKKITEEKTDEIKNIEKTGIKRIGKELSLDQAEAAFSDPEGVILIKGCAGSGKTNILFHRMEYLLNEFPDDFNELNLLILCYNKPLQNYFSHSVKVSGFPKIKSLTVDKFFYDTFISCYKKYVDFDDKPIIDFNEIQNIVKKFLKNGPKDVFIRDKSKDTKKGNVYRFNIHINPDLLEIILGKKISTYNKFHELLGLYFLSKTKITYTYNKNLDIYGYYGEILGERFPIKNLIKDYELKDGTKKIFTFNKPIFDHIFIDEVQDLTPLQINIIDGFHDNSMTIAGDETQMIKEVKDNYLEKALQIKIDKIFELKVSYRASRETMLFAQEFTKNLSLKNNAEGVASKGEKPEIVLLKDYDEEFGFIEGTIKNIMKQQSDAKFSIIYNNENKCLMLDKYLKSKGLDSYFAKGKEWNFDKNLHITTYLQAKGLEFDYVFLGDINNIYNIDDYRYRLYTLATRPLKKLYVLNTGTPLAKVFNDFDKSTYILKGNNLKSKIKNFFFGN